MPEEVYTDPGQWHAWVCPDGVGKVKVTLKGAGSGGVGGGAVQGYAPVVPGQTYFISVGQQGESHSGRQPGAPVNGAGGGGGRGRGTGNGGDSGGGFSMFGQGGPPGVVIALAGGAGGKGGDGAPGGAGGDTTGEQGGKGGSSSGPITLASGGTQTTPGQGGTNGSTANQDFDGSDATAARLGVAGAGGVVTFTDGNFHGGGGGGGGWFGGGGGTASGAGSPAGGGGGGSNYDVGLIREWGQVINQRNGGMTGNGEVRIEWVSPPPPIQPPPPPSDLKVEGVELGSDTSTRALTSVTFTAGIANVPNAARTTQMIVRLVAQDNDDSTEEWNFNNYFSVASKFTPTGDGDGRLSPVSVTVSGLAPNTKYYVRAYSFDSAGNWSVGQGEDPTQGGFAGGSFWTNRPPTPPTLLTPSENTQFEIIDNIFFSWTPVDPDDDDAQLGWELRTRRLTRPNEAVVTNWQTVAGGRIETAVTLGAAGFTGNQFYVWSVRTRDTAGVWSNWATPKSFFVEAGTTPPVIIYPKQGFALPAAQTNIFQWQYLDPVDGGTQVKADVRYRVVGAADWITFFGEPDPAQPGQFPEWAFPVDTFIEGYHYEWQVRTTSSSALTSDWSVVETFWAVAQIGQGLTPVYIAPEHESVQPPLGCGNNRVYIYDRGGEVMRGEITDYVMLRYHRKRDDISSCTIITNGHGKDCGALLKEVRCWMHEIVIFRDGKRVWEGPITRTTNEPGQMEIEAKDVMAYIYRRIMRQGYNDTFRKVNGIESRGMSVVHRAAIITMNALAYDDPNVLSWLTEIVHSDDAIQMRAVPDYSKTAWEEIDDLAATAGLDYTVLGRRIIYWDVHRPLGRLPEMRDEHFSAPVHVTEYGMQLANYFAVTNNDGVYGVAWRGLGEVSGEHPEDLVLGLNEQGQRIPPFYGWVEQLVSAYGETEGEVGDALTEEGRAELEQTLKAQAERGISPRWPTPLVVRVPDNSTIQPDVNLGFDQLVPGVWIPVRASGTMREVAQWQKLDMVTVEQTADSGERIMVTMSPAPNNGVDPDADAAAEELG